MQASINNSREMIKSRMLKHALNYWSIKNAEDLDPVVKLILEALSLELYNLGSEIRDTEARILEKIANQLVPGFLTCPNTAHAILHVAPAEATELLTITDQFYTQKKTSSQNDGVMDGTIDVFFSSIGAIKLFDAKPAAFATHTNFYTIDVNNNSRILACQTASGTQFGNNTAWLGLKINSAITNLEGLFFCADWKNDDQHSIRLTSQLLPLVKLEYKGAVLPTISGLVFDETADADSTQNKSEFDTYDLLHIMEQNIKNNYNARYITVNKSFAYNAADMTELYPESFARYFNQADLAKFTEKLFWIKITFPAAITREKLEDVYFYTNAIPVMNRKLTELRYRLKGGSNIVPLKTTGFEQFLMVRSFSDDNHTYVSTPYNKTEDEEIGTYTVRNGGLERFDGRNAREMIGYLLELLRTESAAFSIYGYDFVATILKEINQRIALMEQKTRGLHTSAAEIPNYIIAKPFEGHELMYAEYWTTVAEAANNLKTGTKLQQYNKSKANPESLYLVTSTIGGKNKLKPEERINAFRYSLITRNRIVTKEDIKVFCAYELGNRLKQVTVEKGIEMSSNPKEGYRRTIDIFIALSESLQADEWNVLCSQMEAKLISLSGISNYYRIILKGA